MAFPETSVLDDFNRSDEGPPMTGWEDAYDDDIFEVASNQALYNKPASRTFGGALWSASSFGPNCEAFATIVGLPESNPGPSSGTPGILICCANPGASTLDGYVVQRRTSGEVEVYRIDNGGFTQLGTDLAFAPDMQIGDKLGVHHDGNETISVYQDTGSGWTLLGTRTDSTYTSGQIGLWAFDGTETETIAFDDFGGGTVSGAIAVGIVSESNTALALITSQEIAAGLVSETDTALPLSEHQTVAVGLVTETDNALPLTSGQGAESELEFWMYYFTSWRR